jgi:phosphatidyl-myo-inositol dimannoside synthase
VRHLLVSNDFPPKVGGIQSYLWELWRRLPPEASFVHTTPYEGAAAFDAAHGLRISRSAGPVLLPLPHVARRVDRMARELDVDLVVLDPALPLGAIGPFLDRPYAVVLHGAEVTVPARLPGTGRALGAVLRGARLVISAGEYAAAEAERCADRALPVVVVPPGVDTARFRPLDPAERRAARSRHDLEDEDLVVVSVSRLVPRKGMDVLIRAAARLRPRFPGLRVVIAGTGRDRRRLGALVAATGAPVEFVGFVPDEGLPALYGMADVFAMLCRSRWAGLEQEGFGIVFAEAAACGVPSVCGRSGGAEEAVEHDVSGLVVANPRSVAATANALAVLAADPGRRARFGAHARRRAVERFDYDLLAGRLADALAAACEPVPGR